MICPPCSEAGRRVTAAKALIALTPRAHTDLYVSGALQEEAVKIHAQCEAPETCSCQHHTCLDALKTIAALRIGKPNLRILHNFLNFHTRLGRQRPSLPANVPYLATVRTKVTRRTRSLGGFELAASTVPL